jgi:hypothetical protein
VPIPFDTCARARANISSGVVVIDNCWRFFVLRSIFFNLVLVYMLMMLLFGGLFALTDMLHLKTSSFCNVAFNIARYSLCPIILDYFGKLK